MPRRVSLPCSGNHLSGISIACLTSLLIAQVLDLTVLSRLPNLFVLVDAKQVRVVTRNICESLEEDSFRPILHHYDGPKFRLELSVPEVSLLLFPLPIESKS